MNQLANTEVFVFDECETGIDGLGQVMRRYLCRHADRDPFRAVQQKIWQPGGQYDRLQFSLIVVGNKIDCFLVDVGQQLMRDFGQTHFCIAHRSRFVPVNRTKVTLPVNEGITHGKILGNTNDGIVNGGIPMRVIFTDDVTGYPGGFLVRFVPRIAKLEHCVKDSPMDWFEAIPDVR